MEEFNFNCQDKYVFNKEFFIEREFQEVPGGVLQEDGFYVTPEGSFWDPEGDYFNKYGFDKYGGNYDQYKVYIPGEGWLEEFQCYKEDLHIKDENELRELMKSRMDEYAQETQDILKMIEKDEEENQEFDASYKSAMKSEVKSKLMNLNMESNQSNKSNISGNPYLNSGNVDMGNINSNMNPNMMQVDNENINMNQSEWIRVFWNLI